MRGRFFVLVAALAAASALLVAQAPGRSVWDGVYSDAQAQRGTVAYDKWCAGCHGVKLEGLGLGNGPALAGTLFIENWEGSLLNLFEMMKSPMPRAEDVAVPDKDVLDVLAFVLQYNGMPARQDLDAGALASITMVGKGGPTPVRDMALGRIVGCLAQGPDKSWVLNNATEPAKTRGEPSTEAQLKAAAAEKLGTQMFTLLDVFPSPDEHKGHRMEAKGILIRKTNSLNVTVLEPVAQRCP